MLHISKRQLFITYLCKVCFYAGLPASSISFASEEIKQIDQICNTKENITRTIKKTWFAKSAPKSDGQLNASKPERRESHSQTTRQEKGRARLPERSDDLRDVYHWGTSVLLLIQKYQQNPLRASRILSYVQVGMHDAWTLTHEEIGKENHDSAVCEFASHRAASLLLSHFYPNESRERFEAEFVYLTQKLNVAGQDRSLAIATGESVAAQLIDRSWQDGAARVWDLKLRPAAFAGIWSPSFPLYAVNPTEGMAAQWRPWVKPSNDRYIPPKAALPGSDIHAIEMQQVIAVNRQLTLNEIEAAKRWNLEAGSVTPAGVWFQLAKEEIRKNLTHCDKGTSKAFAIHVLTDLAVAMHDAFIACWAIKFRDWSERPITAIRRSADPQFLPLLVTPSFPSYVSGHATISAAAAVVLSHHFPNQTNNYQLLAIEAANSRLWGGIHYDSDNKQGLLLGATVGAEVIQSKQKS